MRQEIQGLRAVAVLLVVLFHLWPDRVPGGYIGVDVFFVISGFLITSLLVREVDRSGSVDLAGFWARRIRRLLPAAYVVLVVSAVGVVSLVPRTQWQQFLGEILGAGLYVENWLLALGSVDYLAADAPPSPAQHYWTLSAEEQFYLVWPLLVLVGIWLARRHASKKAGIFAVLAVGALASLAYSLWVTATNPAWAYFVTPARAWEFGAGALLAFAPSAARLLSPSLRALLGWAALAALLAGAFVLDESTPMPGTAAIWIVLAAGALIWVEAPGLSWSSDRLLTVRPARAMGDISYAVYLWHWPLIILLPYATHHALTTLDKVSVLMATIGLSVLTKKIVEDPVRAARRFGLARSRVTFAYAATGALVLTAVCLVPRSDVSREIERTQRVAAELIAQPPDCFGAAARDPRAEDCPNPRLANTLVPAPEAAADDYPKDGCRAALQADAVEPCRFGNPRAGVPHVAVVGDSHARVLMTTVERLVEEGTLSADKFVASACPWSSKPPAAKSPFAPGCTAFRSRFYPYLEDHATDYDAVITTARLTTLQGTPAELVDGMSRAWTRVTRQGVPVVVVRDNPTARDGGRGDPQSCLATVPVSRANETCALDRHERLDGWFDALAAAARRTPGAHLVDLTPFYCDEDTCPVVVGGVNVYRDHNHLTVTYARTLAPYLYRAIRDTGVLRG